ncbi:hypothetical protein BDV93DRAFT_565506 [Ceratobasidium sp. AG-I]|nr:hypothetical protein BDV93DRAFT_565506 [Ceratobasidium sp. AG-I]
MANYPKNAEFFWSKRTFSEDEDLHPATQKQVAPSPVEINGQRYVERMIRRSLEKRKVLPFRISEFQHERDKGNIVLNAQPVEKPTIKPFEPTLSEHTEVFAADGPQLFVDLDDRFVLFYNPDFVPSKLARTLYEAIKKIVEAQKPPEDGITGEKRSTGEVSAGEVVVEDGDASVKTGDTVYKLRPSRYHLSPAWYGTGQEKKGEKPVVSTDLKTLLDGPAREAYMEYLSCSKEVNYQIRHAVDMLSPGLGHLLQRLNSTVTELGSPSSEVLKSNWNSAYMCQAIAFNRKTEIHRDTKGFVNNLDVLYLLGDFKPGHLKFQDLNMSVEWGQRNLCIFDGYTFAHEASDCGRGRICCISFCRSGTFRGLKIPMDIPVPSVHDIPKSLRRNP